MAQPPKHSKTKKKQDNRSLLQRLFEEYATDKNTRRRTDEAVKKATGKK